MLLFHLLFRHLFPAVKLARQDGIHRVPQLILQSLHIDLLANSELVQLNLLIQATCCIESLHRLNLEHVPKIILLLHLTVVAETVRFHLFEAHFDVRVLVLTTKVVIHVAVVAAVLVHQAAIRAADVVHLLLGCLDEVSFLVHILLRILFSVLNHLIGLSVERKKRVRIRFRRLMKEV